LRDAEYGINDPTFSQPSLMSTLITTAILVCYIVFTECQAKIYRVWRIKTTR